MCTVTYIPKVNNTFILTSNRDEAIGRNTLAPDFYDVNGVKMLFPKDEVAGGSWIGISQKCRLISLLNGGFECHEHTGNYKMSRGVVVKELLKAEDVHEAITAFDFNNIEPFTIVALDWQSDLLAIELVWDGREKHLTELDDSPRIWSSSTLYNSAARSKRKTWFDEFSQKTNWSISELFGFHTSAGEGNANIDLLMDKGHIKTVSVTQVEKMEENCTMTYYDFQKEEVKKTKLR